MKKFCFSFIVTIFCIGFYISAYAVPAIYKLVIDATGSISRSEFKKANNAVHSFIYDLYQRSQAHPGGLSDWISVSYFGKGSDYFGSKFINCSSTAEMILLQDFVNHTGDNHPGFSNTAIYDATGLATMELTLHERKLGQKYFKVIAVVTDGEDNNSNFQIRKKIKELYPYDSIYLIVVAVGSQAGKVKAQFNEDANQVVTIDNFSQLQRALLFVQELTD